MKNDKIAETYAYTRTRAGGVFALAGVAAGGALLLVWGAWATLDGATRNQRIASPPDLKSIVRTVEVKAEQVAGRAARENRAEARTGE